MNTAEVSAASPGIAPVAGPIFRTTRSALLLLFGIIYAGSLEFFITFSPVLLYGTYVVIIACLAVCLAFDWSLTRNVRSVAPYLIWTLGYFIWGMIATSSEAIVTTEGLKLYIKNFLLISSLALALDRRNLKPFAQLIQVAAIANLGLCLWEAANPALIAQIAHTRQEGATAFDVLRPAGLWSNPDEAASSFIFALLLSRWAGFPLAWLGRLSAVVGIYLGASRTGAYLLVICGLAYAGYWLKGHRIDSARLAVLFAALLSVGAAAIAVAVHFDFDPAEHWKFARILDVTEGEHAPADGSRRDIAIMAIQTAIEGPWYGHGLFTFQMHAQESIPTAIDPPSHNIYLAVWGEAGPLVAITYLLILAAGLRRALVLPMLSADRIAVLLMWFCYLLIGLTWHNQFTAFSGMIYVALLWHLPAILQTHRALQNVAREPVCA